MTPKSKCQLVARCFLSAATNKPIYTNYQKYYNPSKSKKS